MKLYQRVKDFAMLNGVTIAEVEKQLGFSKGSISKWDKNVPSYQKIELVADLFRIPVDYLTGRIDKTNIDMLNVFSLENSVKIKVLGRVAAGIPIEAIEEVIGEEEISMRMAQTGNFFGLRISGDSMEPKIYSGNIVIVRQQEDVDTGDIAIVMVNGSDATCKKVEKYDNGIMLVPFNSDYETRFYSNEEIESLPVKIIGKVVESRAKF